MQITSINSIDCKRKGLNFTNSGEINSSKGKKRYKHYEEVSDDVLRMRSILTAHQEVSRSGKMQFFKAIPTITAGAIGLSLGLTRPGKLSAKIATGLGFLALVQLTGKAFDGINKIVDNKYLKNNDDNEAKKTLEKLGLTFALFSTSVLAAFGLKKLANAKALSPVSDFVKKEAATLSNEINETKLGKFVDKTLNPFANKHKDAMATLSLMSPFALLGLESFAAIKVSDGLSKDIQQKANENYQKGKIVQALAREHFNSIDAIEV